MNLRVETRATCGWGQWGFRVNRGSDEIITEVHLKTVYKR